MRLTARDLGHLAAELRQAAEGVDDVSRALDGETVLDFPPTSMTARLWLAVDLDSTVGRRS